MLILFIGKQYFPSLRTSERSSTRQLQIYTRNWEPEDWDQRPRFGDFFIGVSQSLRSLVLTKGIAGSGYEIGLQCAFISCRVSRGKGKEEVEEDYAYSKRIGSAMENDILDSLEDLGYKGPLTEEGALLKCIQGEEITSEFMGLCKWLTDDIQEFSGVIENITGVDKDEFSIEISGFLREYGCPHAELLGVTGLSSPPNRLLLLAFLTSELQACRILGQKEDAMDVDEQEASPAFQHLSAILTSLGLPQPTEQSSVFELLSDIEKKVNDTIRKCPKGHLGEPLLTKHLNAAQWAQVNKINDTLLREYSLRRQTLLTRLDVTIRSFQWSELGQKKQDSISGEFLPIRTSLEIQAPVSLADVLAARNDLTKVMKTSSEAVREKTKCAINRVLIGKVPFRGGKPSAKGPPPDMPQFAKREAPKNQRQGGRGERGGGGGYRGGRGSNRGGRDDNRKGNRLQGGSSASGGSLDGREQRWANRGGRGGHDGDIFGGMRAYDKRDTRDTFGS